MHDKWIHSGKRNVGRMIFIIQRNEKTIFFFTEQMIFWNKLKKNDIFFLNEFDSIEFYRTNNYTEQSVKKRTK